MIRSLMGNTNMNNHFANAADDLDANVFSGDALFDAENRALLRRLLERWKHKLEEWEELAAEIADGSEP